MRIFIITALLVTISLAGCLDDSDLSGPMPNGAGTSGSQEKMPSRQFEPALIFRAQNDIIKSGEMVNLTMDLTDMHDYPYPATFIDWLLIYDRAPNPVHEGDATHFEALYNQTMYAEGYHMFLFRVDDGQGLLDRTVMTIQVGEPAESPPSAEDIAIFIEDVEIQYGGAPARPPPVVPVEEVPDALIHDWTVRAPVDCGGCVDGNPARAFEVDDSAPFPGAMGCTGFQQGLNYVDCAWVHISEAAWGHEFEVSSTIVNDLPQLHLAGDPGSIDVEFFVECSPNGPPYPDPDDPEAYDPSTYDPTAYGSLGQDYIDLDKDVESGIIPEGAGCLVAFEYAWPTLGGVDIRFQWTEDYNGPFTAFHVIPTVPTENGPCSIPEVESCGPARCDGLAINWNGYGCAWIEITPNMWGATFDVLGADPDARALSDCSQEATVIESFGAIGPEIGLLYEYTIPEGTACLMAYEFNGVLEPLTFDVYFPEA